MSHANHTALPGYDEAHVWHDGCPECELRGADLALSLGNMDGALFAYAWKRAAEWSTVDGNIGTTSKAEMLTLRSLWAVQVMFERTIGIPLGQLPLSPSYLGALMNTKEQL